MAITLGLVEAIDSNGVYVTVPGSRGVVRGPYETLARVAVSDRVALQQTDGGGFVVLGPVSAAPAHDGHPTTTTDNAVARFDGTSGKLQNSGVTITDGGAIQSDSSSGEFRFGSAAGSLDFIISGYASGNNAAVFFRTGTAKRWFVGKEATAESGSNAGSNFRIWRYNDDGSSIGEALGIRRDTGKVTIGSVGSTAGIELGSSGPTITTGTGAPSHSAPNGSIYLRTDGTASTTLYVRAAGAWSALS